MHSHFKFIVVGDLSRIETTCDRNHNLYSLGPPCESYCQSRSLAPSSWLQIWDRALKFSCGHAALTFLEQAL